MTVTTIDLVDSDLSTSLFDLNDPTGANNAAFGSVVTKFGVGSSLKTTAPQDAERFQHPALDGGFTTFSRRGLGTATWKQVIEGSSEANLRLGYGRLVDIVTRGGILRIVTSTKTRYLRFEPSEYPTPLEGNELELWRTFQAFKIDGMTVNLACQPFWEEPEVTVGPTSVPNNPANGSKARVLEVLGVLGDLPTPAKVKIQITAESKTLQTSAAADDIVDCNTHGFQVGDAIVFTALTGGSGLTTNTVYYVTATSFGTNTFRPATTPGGTAINFTTDITAGAVQLAGTVQEILVATRARNTRAASYFADALSDWYYADLDASARGWTVTLDASTTSSADTRASGGNSALIDHATNPTVMHRRTTITRTTKLDCARGSWDVWGRFLAVGARDFRAQLRWGPSTVDPPAFTLPEVPHDVPSGATVFGYVEKKLGRIHIPEEVALSGLRFEVHTRLNSGTDQDLRADFLWFVPADRQGTIVNPFAASQSWEGSELVTPTNPGGLTAGTVSGHDLILNAATEAGGSPPAGGTAFAEGLHRTTLFWHENAPSGVSPSLSLGIRNITDSTYVVTAVPGTGGAPAERTHTFEWFAAAGKLYEPQMIFDTGPGTVKFHGIRDDYIQVLGNLDHARTDPMRSQVDRLDSSSGLSGYLDIEGQVPCVLDPGDNHVMMRALEVPLTLYDEGQSQLARILTASVSYFPRYGF